MMPAHYPGSQLSIVLDSDGVRRFATEQRQAPPSRILAVVERSAYTCDPSGAKHAYVPFLSIIKLVGHHAQRSERGLHFDFSVTLCDSTHRPVMTLSGSCKNGELDVAILDALAALTGTARISTPVSIDLLIANSEGLGHADLAANKVFWLNPPWLFGTNMNAANQASAEALASCQKSYRSRSSVIAYTDGSLPHHRRDRGAGAMVTMQGHWASQIAPRNFSRSPLMAETTGPLLAIRHTPLESDLTIFSDCRALVGYINSIAHSDSYSRRAHEVALGIALERRRGQTRAVWVRGHNGNCFNEAADRMAILMARHFNAGISPERTHTLMQKIVAEELALAV